MSDFDAESMPVQRTIDAVNAAPVAGARSPWPFETFGRSEKAERGDEPAAAAPAAPKQGLVHRGDRGRSDLPRRLVEALTDRGPLNVLQLSEALGVPYASPLKWPAMRNRAASFSG